jgi:hypothetical protein
LTKIQEDNKLAVNSLSILNNITDNNYYRTIKPKRTDYHKVRVIKKNLVYIIGLAPGLAREEVF